MRMTFGTKFSVKYLNRAFPAVQYNGFFKHRATTDGCAFAFTRLLHFYCDFHEEGQLAGIATILQRKLIHIDTGCQNRCLFHADIHSVVDHRLIRDRKENRQILHTIAIGTAVKYAPDIHTNRLIHLGRFAVPHALMRSVAPRTIRHKSIPHLSVVVHLPWNRAVVTTIL